VHTGALDHFPNKDELLRSVERTPAGRLVEADDIAGAVSFLCSPDADMVRGQTLVVDGGFSLPA
jgi:enoyl-[acyl-carrier protein] reductase III